MSCDRESTLTAFFCISKITQASNQQRHTSDTVNHNTSRILHHQNSPTSTTNNKSAAASAQISSCLGSICCCSSAGAGLQLQLWLKMRNTSQFGSLCKSKAQRPCEATNLGLHRGDLSVALAEPSERARKAGLVTQVNERHQNWRGSKLDTSVTFFFPR